VTNDKGNQHSQYSRAPASIRHRDGRHDRADFWRGCCGWGDEADRTDRAAAFNGLEKRSGYYET
jgi:hypothetical protein